MDIILRSATADSPTPPGFPRFNHYGPNSEVAYLNLDWAKEAYSLTALVQRLRELEGVKRLIIANEAFCPGSGDLRRNAAFKLWGEEWIGKVAKTARYWLPETELWVCDFRPRDWVLWQSIRAYVQAHKLPIAGLGIQVHASLLPCLPTHWASPQNVPPLLGFHCRLTQADGLKVAFPEVTCWSQSDAARGDWYERLIALANRQGVDWLTLWSPTPADAWHWSKSPPPPCHLWDERGQWLWDNWRID